MSDLAAIADLDQLGDSLRERRIELGWTQAELARRTGIPQADISRLENGRLDARWSTIHRLSLALAGDHRPQRSLANAGRRPSPPRSAKAWKPKGQTTPRIERPRSSSPSTISEIVDGCEPMGDLARFVTTT